MFQGICHLFDQITNNTEENMEYFSTQPFSIEDNLSS